MRVLGIETSCDETAAAVVSERGVLSDVVYAQDVHRAYGGVVPELASRAHVEKIAVVARDALSRAGCPRPDGVAATAGPGLIGAVLVGLSFAKGLAAAWDVPFVAVNHLEGHLLSPLLEDPPPAWPFLGLVVSGGHSTLYRCEGLGRYEVLGETVDDAAGEAYDKVARLLGLGYPGGPPIDRLAAAGRADAVRFPRPDPGGLDLSFSGLKTAVRTYLERGGDARVEDVCASFQEAVIDCLVGRVLAAADRTGIRRVVVAGGVAANRGLRARLRSEAIEVTLPPPSRCTDNGAMIAHAGRLRLMAGLADGLDAVARPAWSLA